MKRKHESEEDAVRRISRWVETWFMCTAAFTWYYGGDFQTIKERALRTGWTPSVVLDVGKHKYHVCTTQIHEEWCFGSKTSGTVPQKLFDRSKADIFVISVLNIPDVDIVGWLHRNELTGAVEGSRYVLREPVSHPMSECPGLARRDKNHWYI